MARFFYNLLDSEMINLDLVATARTRQDRKDNTYTTLWDAAGDEFARLPGVQALDRMTAPLLPAAPGLVAVEISIRTHRRPTAADVRTRTYPVVGWRIFEGGVEPLVPEHPVPSQDCYLQLDDGRLVSSSYEFVSIAAAERQLLEDAQHNWDAEREEEA